MEVLFDGLYFGLPLQIHISYMSDAAPLLPATQLLTTLLENANRPEINSLLQQQSKSKMNIGFPPFLFPVDTDFATICKTCTYGNESSINVLFSEKIVTCLLTIALALFSLEELHYNNYL